MPASPGGQANWRYVLLHDAGDDVAPAAGVLPKGQTDVWGVGNSLVFVCLSSIPVVARGAGANTRFWRLPLLKSRA
jgi:hypothetical protein